MSGDNSHPAAQANLPQGLRQRATLPLIIVAALFIIVPFLAWYGTWFGRDLSDEKITEYLADEKNPRHVQHALSQLAEKLEKKDASARRWYPQIAALSNSNVPELRSNAAWLMGKDNQAQEFHEALLKLLRDGEPIVQRNAAVSLVAFNDRNALPVVRSMLQPYALTAPVEGEVNSILKVGSPVKVGMMLSRLKQGEQVWEVRSPLPGELSQVAAGVGAKLKAGDTLLYITPDESTVWEALRALYLIGEKEDLPVAESYAQGSGKLSAEIKEQAALTAKAIQRRS
ncbi:MAG: HEAT repeat domain-containing protein, partial [Acidobacteria bacterium]|nr:HEAT repeat domain-containing protein [Acidobacteriota bacterium]